MNYDAWLHEGFIRVAVFFSTFPHHLNVDILFRDGSYLSRAFPRALEINGALRRPELFSTSHNACSKYKCANEMLGGSTNLILSRQLLPPYDPDFGYVRVLPTGGHSFITYIGYCEKCTKCGCIGLHG